MKKVAMVAASALLAGVMCIGFAACGSSAKDVVGEEVTKEQWAEALKIENFENFKFVSEGTTETTIDDETGKETEKVTLIVADGKEYYKAEASAEGETETVEYYWDGENQVGYEKDEDGKWVEAEYGHSFASVATGYTMLASSYEAFEYSKDDKGYVIKEEYVEQFGEMGKMGLVVKIKDGKLAALCLSFETEQSAFGITTKIKTEGGAVYTYGGQSVTLPTVG